MVNKVPDDVTPMNPDHDISIVSDITPATPIFLTFIGLSIIIIMRRVALEFMEENGYIRSNIKPIVIESLPAFNNVVQSTESDKLLKANRYFRENYDFTVSTKVLEDSLTNQRIALSPMA